MKYTESIEQRVWDFIQQHQMLKPGDRVVAGVSGGADSVCLLLLLVKWSQEIPFSVHAVHVNHGIRREAKEDAAYVEALCGKYHVPFTLVEENVRERALREKRSEEEMGRMVRYEAFAAAEPSGTARIAVAHNSNDLAETMLFHLFRGSGLSGLCGIRPVRDNVIRPILCLERKEIEAYLTQRGVRWCVDATNEEDEYTRNRIRHHILPYVEQEIVKGCIPHMVQTASMLADTERYLDRVTQEARGRLVQEQEERVSIDRKGYNSLDPVIGRRLLYQLLRDNSPGRRDIACVHVQDVEKLFVREGNGGISLPYGMIARREYDRVLLEWPERAMTQKDESGLSEALKKPEGEGISIELRDLLLKPAAVEMTGTETLYFQVFSDENFFEKIEDIPQNRYTKWFDYDKIKQSLTVRARKTGDFLSIRGSGNGEVIHKSVKDYMVAARIPRQERNRIPLIADGEHVLWIVGYRISENYKISKNTKRILQVQLKRGCNCSETEENNGRTC